MDQGGDGRRALHRVGQPGVQADLRRLAHGADEEQQAQAGQRIDVPGQEVHGLADLFGRRREDGLELHAAEDHEHAEDA
jgi:hypothetical protein